MHRNLERLLRGYVIVLLAVLLWAVWRAEAQPADPPASDPVSAGASNLVAKAQSETLKGLTLVRPEWVEALAEDLPFLKSRVWGNELWKYIFSLLYIFLAFYVSKLLDYLTRVWLKKLAEQTRTRLDDLILELLNGPVKIVAFVIFLRIGLDVFDWPDLVQLILAKGLAVVVAITITYLALKLVDLLLGYWRLRVSSDDDKAFNEQLFPILRKALKLFIVVVAVLVTLSNIGVNVTAAIASLSIGGLAIGLAAQDTLANLFGAVAVFLDKPFKVGDRIQLDAVDGTVESVGIRSTRVRNLDGHLVTIPNKTVGNATITNVAARPSIRTVMTIGVTYDTPAPKLKRALALIEEVYRSTPKTADLIVGFNKFGNSSLDILVVHWWGGTVFKDYIAGLQELNLQLKERFDAERISFAFPTQTLYVKQDSDWCLAPLPIPEKPQAA